MQFAKRVDTCNIKNYFRDFKNQGQVPKFEPTQ